MKTETTKILSKGDTKMIARMIKLSLLVALLFGLSPVAFAGPSGTSAPIVFDDGGTVTGFFTLDPTGTTLTGYSFTTSGGTSGLSPFTYDGTDSTGTFSLITPGATASGPPVAVLNIFSPDVPSRPRHNLEFSFYDPGLTLGANLGLCDIDGGACLTDGPLSIQVQSGEQFLDANSSETARNVKTGSFDITDPELSFAFNSNSSQTGTGTPVPEPASVLLLCAAIVGWVGIGRKLS
jgi:hypothetical protein